MMPLIETRGLTKRYGQVLALSGVDLDVPKGATGLLGPNGAGKSTLIRSLIGLVSPDSGTGRIFGRDIASNGLEIRRRIGYMPEHDCLIQDMSAVEMVAYAGLLSGMSRSDAIQRSHEVLHFVGMDDERYRKIETYSSGMRQKVNLAQALVHDPELLLLDEPTSGLDPKGRVEMLELFRFLTDRQGESILLSTHILPDVEFVCNNVVVLADGEVLLQGDIGEQLRGDTGVVNVRMVGDREAFSAALGGRGYAVEDDGYLIRVTTGGEARVPEDIFSDVVASASETDVQIRYASRTARNLEDLFMELVEDRGGSQ